MTSSQELTKSNIVCDDKSTAKTNSPSLANSPGASEAFAHSANTIAESRLREHNCSTTTSQIMATQGRS